MTIDKDLRTENKQIVHRFFDECWNLGKFESLRELVAEDCRIHDPVFPSLGSNLTNLQRHIILCRAGFPDMHFTLDDTIAEHDEVVVHWTARGTHEYTFLGLEPTHRHASISGTSIFRIERSKIVEQWANWNLMSLLEELGLAKTPLTREKARVR